MAFTTKNVTGEYVFLTCLVSVFTLYPSIYAWPVVIASSPVNILKVVVFPAPLTPIRLWKRWWVKHLIPMGNVQKLTDSLRCWNCLKTHETILQFYHVAQEEGRGVGKVVGEQCYWLGVKWIIKGSKPWCGGARVHSQHKLQYLMVFLHLFLSSCSVKIIGKVHAPFARHFLAQLLHHQDHQTVFFKMDADADSQILQT